MAIVFSEKQKNQQYLILIFIFVSIVTGLVFYFGVFKKPEEKSIIVLAPPKKVEIDFQVFENSLLSKLEQFEEIVEFEGEIGRDNPFNPFEAEIQ